jgi:thiamine biosynthesis lipoprotein
MLAVRPGTARLAAGTALDLGGIAKGWMADELAARLGDDCVVNLGGDLFARGRWTVAFAGQTVVLDGLGAATSGSWRRRWGDGLHHLIDPRTGAPSASDVSQVSVIASTASLAETLAKTALIQGRDAGEAWLRGRALGYAVA